MVIVQKPEAKHFPENFYIFLSCSEWSGMHYIFYLNLSSDFARFFFYLSIPLDR